MKQVGGAVPLQQMELKLLPSPDSSGNLVLIKVKSLVINYLYCSVSVQIVQRQWVKLTVMLC